MSDFLRSEVIEACRALCLAEGLDPDKKVHHEGQQVSAWVTKIPTASLVLKTVERSHVRTRWMADARIRCLEAAVRMTGKGGDVLTKADELLSYVVNGEDPADSAKEIEALKGSVAALTQQLQATETLVAAGKEIARRQSIAPKVEVKDGAVIGLNGTGNGAYRLVADA